MEQIYRIRVVAIGIDSWISDCDGDPGRTKVEEHAKLYYSKGEAESTLKELQEKYPRRSFYIDPLYKSIPKS